MSDRGWEPIASAYLAMADRLLPGRIVGFYVVGSAALGAWRTGRSDLDFVAVLDNEREGDIRRLRAIHVLTSGAAALRTAVRHPLALPGNPNGLYVRAADLSTPVTEIVPVASHTGGRFSPGAAFDANPVVWKVLAGQGIAVRGPAPSALGLDPQPDRLRAWNLDNLDRYWRPWGERHARGVRLAARVRGRWTTAWGVLGAPRLHCTIATGDVVSKEGAGEYALRTFGAEWHPIIGEALAYWRGEPLGAETGSVADRITTAGRFVVEVVRSARSL